MKLWEEFIVEVKPPKHLEHILETMPVCGLCGNSGMIESQAKTAYGVPCGVIKPCICPNGRSIKKRNS